MVWPGREVSNAALAEGYTLRSYLGGDLESYLALMHGAGFIQFTPDTVAEFLGKALPNGVFVVEHSDSGKIVATAMALQRPQELHPSGGELGWVAGDKDHAGKGLGAAVCAAAVTRFLGAGYSRIYLQTDDNRLAAIKVYLKLGFVPYLFAWDMEERWQVVCEKLNWSFAATEWPKAPESIFRRREPESPWS